MEYRKKTVIAIMEMYKASSSKVMVNGQFSKLFYITKGVLQGDTLAPFLFIIVLDYVLKVTELGNFGIQTHTDKTLHDLDAEQGCQNWYCQNSEAWVRRDDNDLVH